MRNTHSCRGAGQLAGSQALTNGSYIVRKGCLIPRLAHIQNHATFPNDHWAISLSPTLFNYCSHASLAMVKIIHILTWFNRGLHYYISKPFVCIQLPLLQALVMIKALSSIPFWTFHVHLDLILMVACLRTGLISTVFGT